MYGIAEIPLTSLPVTSEIRDHFVRARSDVVGGLVPIGNGAVIVENDSHPPVRRRSTMGHKLAHVFGEHKSDTSLVNERGCRIANQVQDEEAAEIADELLAPFESAKLLARRKATNEEIALQFGVSTDLARWRMDATGARLIARRQASARSRVSGQ